MHYQLFFPNETHYSPELLERSGLADLVRAGDRQPTLFPLVGNGPDGKNRGVVFDWGSLRPGYFPAEQTWRPLGNGVWFGINNASPPMPADLVRPAEMLIDGFVRSLSDGNEWAIPNVAKIPVRFGLDADGRPERKNAPAFGHFAKLAMEVFDALARQIRGESDIEWTAGVELAARILSVNFRVAAPVCYALELFDQRNVGGVLRDAVDESALYQIFEEVQKKKAEREDQSSDPNT